MIDLAAFSTDATTQVGPIAAEQAPPALDIDAGGEDADAERVEEGTAPRDGRAPTNAAAPADEAANRGTPLPPLRPGDVRLVDSLIGQINGRPIFAQQFFAPIEDRLVRVAQEGSRQEFESIIHERLYTVISNELVLSEAEVGLTEQEQMGLFAFLEDVQQNIIAQGGGVESEVEQQLLEETGKTLEETRELGREQVLIRKLLDEKVAPRVIVTWRDVEREYQRRQSEFNRQASVELSRITLASADADAIADVQRRLQAGEDFATIASDLGLPDGGRWQSFPIGEGGVSDIELRQEARDALVGLEKGGVTAPFTLGERTWWLHVTDLVQPEVRSLYDPEVQRGIAQSLEQRRTAEEQQRYIMELFQRGVYDDIDDMRNRLLTIGYARYMPGR